MLQCPGASLHIVLPHLLISFLAHREAMVCSPSSVSTASLSGSAFGGTAALRISRTPLLWRAVAASACPAHHALRMWPVVSGAICPRGLAGCSLLQIVQCLAALLPILCKNAPDGYEWDITCSNLLRLRHGIVLFVSHLCNSILLCRGRRRKSVVHVREAGRAHRLRS